MLIFCSTCRTKLARVEDGWRHADGVPADGHAAKPLAARRCRLFDTDVIGLPGYDRFLAQLVERERSTGNPTEVWRIGLYLFDGHVRGMFRYVVDEDKIPAGSQFQPPADEKLLFLRRHPIVKERMAATKAQA